VSKKILLISTILKVLADQYGNADWSKLFGEYFQVSGGQ